jgi:hypothetical protein
MSKALLPTPLFSGRHCTPLSGRGAQQRPTVAQRLDTLKLPGQEECAWANEKDGR